MENGDTGSKTRGLPKGYIHQHTLWTRREFNARIDSKDWRGSRGMIILMPEKEEKVLHRDFYQLYPETYGGLPRPSADLARVALAHLQAVNPLLGRKQQFTSMMYYVRELARTSTNSEQAAEARLYAKHFEEQLDYYDNALTASDERDFGLWPDIYLKYGQG